MEWSHLHWPSLLVLLKRTRTFRQARLTRTFQSSVRTSLKKICESRMGSQLWGIARIELIHVFSLNSYYIYIHPYISLLPAPTKPQHDDQPEMIQPRTQDATVFERSILPHWPSSSLSLAISAILALIPLPQDPTPLSDASVSLRRSCAQFYACAALKEAEEEDDEFPPGASALCMDSTQEKFHPDVPPPLHPVLALTILGIFEDCQQGNISRMRNRSNRAITTAMDISLHSLGTVASEAQRRAWWSVVG